MKKNYLIRSITFLLVVFSIKSYSQVYGYMNKKITIEVNYASGMYLTPQINSELYDEKHSLRFNFHPEIVLNYTVGKRIDLGLKLGFDKVAFKLPYQVQFGQPERYFNSNTFNNSGLNPAYFQIEDTDNQGSVVSVQGVIRVYKEKYIAPVGLYHQFGFGSHIVSYKNTNIEGYFSDEPLTLSESQRYVQDPLYDKAIFSNEKFKLISLSYVLGNKHVYNSGFYTNFGLGFNLVFESLVDIITKNNFSSLEFKDLIFNQHLIIEAKKSQKIELLFGVGIIF